MRNILIFIGLSGLLYFNNIMQTKALFLIAAILGLFILNSFFKKRAINIVASSLIIIYLIFSYLSYFYSQTGNLGLAEITLEGLLWLFALFLIHTNITLKQISSIALIIVGFSFLESLFAISQYITREETRVAGTFQSYFNKANFYPNALALFLLISTPLSFKIKNNFVFFIVYLVNSLALLLTFSRGGLIVFILQNIAILGYLIYKNENWRLKTTIVSLIIAVAGLGGMNYFRESHLNLKSQDLAQKYTFSGTERLTSVGERSQFFKGSLLLLRNSPIFGFGPESFGFIYPSVQPILLGTSAHPHNWFLKIGVEKGLITLISFFSIAIYCLLIFFRETKKILSKPILFYTLIALTGGLLHNLIDYNFNFVSNLTIWITLLGLLISNLLRGTTLKTPKIYINVLILGVFTAIFIPLFHKEVSFKIAEINYFSNPTLSQKILADLNYLNSNYLLADLYTNPIDKKDIYTKQINLNKLDAIAHNQLGKLAKTKNDATFHFKEAINLDSKNNLEFYLNYYTKAGTETIKLDQFRIIKMLIDYEEMASQNIHYTSQTGNIDNAIKLANLFYRNTGVLLFYETRLALESHKKSFSRN